MEKRSNKQPLKHGVALVTAIPLRLEPSEKSEMVSQVLFGETYEILKERKGWYLVRCHFDGYEGYLSPSSVDLIPERLFSRIQASQTYVSKAVTQTVLFSGSRDGVLVTAGASIPGFNGKFRFRVGPYVMRFKGRPLKLALKSRTNLVDFARQFIHAPYLWGGRTPFGFDCSGFTQVVYKSFGLAIPRDASAQVREGEVVNWVNEGKPGDLAFFQNPEGAIVHVGILAGNGQILHCSGRVRLDYIDHEGIIHSQSRRYTHHLRVIKNLLGNLD